MNTKSKRLGAKLAVYGSLFGCIAIIALYQPSKEHNSANTASIYSDDSTDARYVTTPLKKYNIQQMEIMVWRTDIPDLQKKISLHLTGTDISTAMSMLVKTTGLNFVCPTPATQNRLTLQLTDKPVWEVMQAVADASGGSWKHHQGVFILSVGPGSRANIMPRIMAVPA